jgi:hypothetical protein
MRILVNGTRGTKETRKKGNAQYFDKSYSELAELLSTSAQCPMPNVLLTNKMKTFDKINNSTD